MDINEAFESFGQSERLTKLRSRSIQTVSWNLWL
jgi:hypothetical protein